MRRLPRRPAVAVARSALPAGAPAAAQPLYIARLACRTRSSGVSSMRDRAYPTRGGEGAYADTRRERSRAVGRDSCCETLRMPACASTSRRRGAAGAARKRYAVTSTAALRARSWRCREAGRCQGLAGASLPRASAATARRRHPLLSAQRSCVGDPVAARGGTASRRELHRLRRHIDAFFASLKSLADEDRITLDAPGIFVRRWASCSPQAVLYLALF